MAEPAWLVAKVDQRLAKLVHEAGVQLRTRPRLDIVMMNLTDPGPGESLDRWERSCDHCSIYCSPVSGPNFYTGHVMRELKNGTPIAICFGVCEAHRFDN